MKFIVFKASDDDYRQEIDLPTLESLMRFRKECKADLIIESTWWEDEDLPSIRIYDDYIE